MAYSNQHEAFEALLKSALPGVPVFQANMPFLKMDELARAEAKTATYLFYKDTERVNTSGASGVHDVVIEVNLFGALTDINALAAALNARLLNGEAQAGDWVFALSAKDKKDIWEPNIKAKRIWIQYSGLMIKGAE